MAEEFRKISELPENEVFTEDSLFIAANPNSNNGYKTESILASEVANKMLNVFEYPLKLDTTDKTIVGAVSEVADMFGTTILEGVLEAGETTLTFSHDYILVGSHFDIYADVQPTSTTVTAGSVTFTFEEQEADMTVRVVVF